MRLEGTVLRGPELEPVRGRVVVEAGEIAAVEADENADGSRVICPAFVNAHTHVGDSIAKEAGRDLTLEELVAPPDGLKHRLLREADREDLVAAMRRSVQFMRASGTGAFVDFREGGVEGVYALREAVDGLDVDPVIMARESTDAMAAGDGFGASGAHDGEFASERRAARSAGKPFGIHAGEADAADVNAALDLDPDFLVHMVHADPIHLERLEDTETPVVVCPRSNLVTGVGTPDVEALAERTTVALGTDNVFLNSPSMFRELEVLSKVCGVDADLALRAATANAAEIAGLECGVVEAGRPAKLLVLDLETPNLSGSLDPVRAVVRRAGVDDVERVVL